VKVAWPAHALDRLGVDRPTYIVVVTHDPKLEEAALTIARAAIMAEVAAVKNGHWGTG
jgi:hypothetical protein